jgi:redox-sensitive bicupin YhaK (pirin superfamily)
MMIQIRKSADRGNANHGWLQAKHSFSFGRYVDRDYMGFRSLKVINEDVIAPGQGFGMHPHENMEIITYVLEGQLEHKDSLGNGSVISRGEVQKITAGAGILHSEHNPSEDAPVHLLQIWIAPDKDGYEPEYEQRAFTLDAEDNSLYCIASGDPERGVLRIHQDAEMFAGVLQAGAVREYIVALGRHVWLQVVRGDISVNGEALSQGDGAMISEEEQLEIRAIADAEFLLFDLQ